MKKSPGEYTLTYATLADIKSGRIPLDVKAKQGFAGTPEWSAQVLATIYGVERNLVWARWPSGVRVRGSDEGGTHGLPRFALSEAEEIAKRLRGRPIPKAAFADDMSRHDAKTIFAEVTAAQAAGEATPEQERQLSAAVKTLEALGLVDTIGGAR